VSFSQTHAHLREWILLDRQSSIDYFTFPSLVKDIHDSKECLMLSTNAGQSMIEQKANVTQWGKVKHYSSVLEEIFKIYQSSGLQLHDCYWVEIEL